MTPKRFHVATLIDKLVVLGTQIEEDGASATGFLLGISNPKRTLWVLGDILPEDVP